MTVFDKMKIEFLLRLKAAGDQILFLVPEFAAKYGIEQRYVREMLVEWHTEKLICLSAWDDNEVRDKPFDEWPNDGSFFAVRWDSGHKRSRLLVRGAEFLEELSADEPETPKHAIGFHG